MQENVLHAMGDTNEEAFALREHKDQVEREQKCVPYVNEREGS